MTTDSILDFLDDRALAGRRRTTIDRYRSVLERLEADTGKDPLKVGHRELRQFLATWQLEHTANGAAFMLRHLKAFYRWGHENGLVTSDPTVGIKLKPDHQPMQTADDADIEKLLAFKGRRRADLRDRAIVHLMVATGARRSEIGLLTVNDLQLDDCLIVISKSKTVRRVVPITEEAAIHLRRWLRARPEKGANLWCSHDGPALVGRVVGRRSRGSVTPHAIRRWFATTWLTRGGSETSLARILGWSSTAMVAVYTRDSPAGGVLRVQQVDERSLSWSGVPSGTDELSDGTTAPPVEATSTGLPVTALPLGNGHAWPTRIEPR